MTLNLFLAIFWVVVAGAFFTVAPPLAGGADWSALWTRPSPGWLAIVLAIYNLIRWWAVRALAERRQGREKASEQRGQRGVEESRAPDA
jgi:membrane protein implicated in regulation of membrane protease activity